MNTRTIPAAVLLILEIAGWATAWGGPAGPDEEARLRSVRKNIVRLKQELGSLETREKGILGQLRRIEAEIALREAEVREAGLRLEALAVEIRTREEKAAALEKEQEERERYLAFRLREMYKQGPGVEFRRTLLTEDAESILSGLRYASFLSEKDARVIRAYKKAGETLREEQARLEEEKARETRILQESAIARNRLQAGLAGRTRLLGRIREDARMRESALEELAEAARGLEALVNGVSGASKGVPVVAMAKFRGLLDPPVQGRLVEGFGEIIHPRFKTKVPHPGLDMEADQGTDIRAVFDGTVIYSAWLRGYGLTVILDHGSGVTSIYSHASVLMVGKGESVLRGQVLGQVGETGSLKGPYLYFELRDHGKPVDPAPWFQGGRDD